MLSRTFAAIVISTLLIILVMLLMAVPWHSTTATDFGDLADLLVFFLAVSAFVGTGMALLMPVVAIVRRTVKSKAAAAAIVIASGALLGPTLLLAFGMFHIGGSAAFAGAGALSAAVWTYLNRNAISRR